MKKLLAILILTGSSTLLQADYNNPGCSSQGGQGYYQQGYQGQPYSQGQGYQGQQGYQVQPYSQGQGYQGQHYMEGQNSQDFYSNQQGYYQAPSPYTQQGYQGGQNFQGQPYGQGQNQYGQGQNGQGQNQNPDQKLSGQIQDSLRSAFSTKYNNVKVSVNNGNVILQGTVPTQEDKTALEQKVRNMDGVRNIDNKVTVQAQK